MDADHEWQEVIDQASTSESSKSLREMFITLLLYCEIKDPAEMWNRNWRLLSKDILQEQDEDEQLKYQVLFEIEKSMNLINRSLKEFPMLPYPLQMKKEKTLIHEEVTYNETQSRGEFLQLYNGLNIHQRNVFTAVKEAVEDKKGGAFFVVGSSGTGKTYLFNLLATDLRSTSKTVITVASSGIASLSLSGGRTAHSMFKIPLQLGKHSVCGIRKGTDLAEFMCKADLIIWDEATMVHKHAFEALDRTFKDLMRNPIKIFGGKTIVLGGDFRQILPTTTEGTRKTRVHALINRSKLWRYFRILSLHENMRIILGASSATTKDKEIFAKWVLDLGNGNLSTIELTHLKDPTWIKIPDEYLIEPDENCVKQISSIIYSGMIDRYGDAEYLSERCILAPNNETVDEINHYIVSTYPGETHHLFSSDSINSMTGSIQREAVAYPTKFLNSLQFPGVPDHHLQLKIGVPVMLLQTVNESMGLCNGTRLVVKQISKRFIEGQIITGNRVGFHVSIPRMIFSPTGANLPFVFKRRQFPVKVCFAMTINKIQGQTLHQVGIYLPAPLCTHGQLYMAVSRTASKEGLKILIKKSDKQPLGFTQNIVYKEVFNYLYPGDIQVVDTPTIMQISETTESNAAVLEVVETGTGNGVSEPPKQTTKSQKCDPSKVAEFESNNPLDDEGYPNKKRLLFHLQSTSGGCSTKDSYST